MAIAGGALPLRQTFAVAHDDRPRLLCELAQAQRRQVRGDDPGPLIEGAAHEGGAVGVVGGAGLHVGHGSPALARG